MSYLEPNDLTHDRRAWWVETEGQEGDLPAPFLYAVVTCERLGNKQRLVVQNRATRSCALALGNVLSNGARLGSIGWHRGGDGWRVGDVCMGSGGLHMAVVQRARRHAACVLQCMAQDE